MLRYFNISECGRNILNRLKVTYEQAYMAITKEEYFTKMLEDLVDYNDCHNAPLSNEKLRQAVSKFTAEMEEEERDAKCKANNITMDTFFYKSPVTTNTQGEIANVTKERHISSDILPEMINGFNGLTIQSGINDSAY